MNYHAKKNIPMLRFPGFEEEWKEVQLSSLSKKISDGIHTTPEYDDTGNYFFINGNNLVENRILITDKTKKIGKAEYEKHKIELGPNTILLSINGTIGNLAYYNDEKVILGKSACYINLYDEVCKPFIFNLIQNYRIIKYFLSEVTGSTIMNLSLGTIKKTKLHLPPLPEQQKIATFLTTIDTRIQQLTRKVDLLEQYKKGVMQQIFSQEIRFKDEEGRDFPAWEEKQLGEIAKVNPKCNGLPNIFVYIDLESVDKGILKKEDIIQKENAPSRAQRILKDNDILFQTVRPYQKNNLFFDKGEGFVASTGYAQIRTKQIPKYLYWFLHTESFVKKVLARCTGTSYPAINSDDLSKILVSIGVVA
ncbi:MAG TPA: restriction endonuclease subunit S [Flavilitoribacter sp.]|nr:restriction endonuclease subunit S [Flavilitoribacter sp.]